MSAPQTLTHPLAARVAGLPDLVENTHNPPIAEGVIEAAIQALKDGKTHYTDRPGILGLRKRVTEYLQRHFNVTLKPDEVTITCGATEARFVVIKRLVKSDGVIVCAGDNSSIQGAAQLVGAGITRVSSTENIRLLYATPNDDVAVLKPLLEAAASYKWWVVWDVSHKTANNFHPAQDTALASKVISIGSFSDSMPGWRVGWMAGSEMADKLRAYKQSMTICSTSISQWAGMGLTEE
jgi:aspartate aminotransferase